MAKGGNDAILADLNDMRALVQRLNGEVEQMQQQVVALEDKNIQLRDDNDMLRRQVGGGRLMKAPRSANIELLQERIKLHKLRVAQWPPVNLEQMEQNHQVQQNMRLNRLAQLRAKRDLDARMLALAEKLLQDIKTLEDEKLGRARDLQTRMSEYHELFMYQDTLLQLLLSHPGPDDMPAASKVRQHVPIPMQLELNLVETFARKVLVEKHKGASTHVCALAWSKSGSRLLALRNDGAHLVWNYCPCFACREASSKQKGYSASERLWSWHSVQDAPNKLRVVAQDHQSEEPSGGQPTKLAISRNENYLLTMVRGSVVLFNLPQCKREVVLYYTNRAATAVAFHPRDANTMAFGLADGSLILNNSQSDHPLSQRFNSHEDAVTGVVFAAKSSTLVTAGADGRLLASALDTVDKMIRQDADQREADLSPTLEDGEGRHVEGSPVTMDLHPKEELVLVCHQHQIATYSVKSLKRVDVWSPAMLGEGLHELQVVSASFSACGSYVYGLFNDGCVLVFSTDCLSLTCRILPELLDPEEFPLGVKIKVLLPHPQPDYTSCFAVALSDGSVQIWKPLKGPKARWEDIANASLLFTPTSSGQGGVPAPLLKMDLNKMAALSLGQSGGGRGGGPSRGASSQKRSWTSRLGSPKPGALHHDLNMEGVADSFPMPPARPHSKIPAGKVPAAHGGSKAGVAKPKGTASREPPAFAADLHTPFLTPTLPLGNPYLDPQRVGGLAALEPVLDLGELDNMARTITINPKAGIPAAAGGDSAGLSGGAASAPDNPLLHAVSQGAQEAQENEAKRLGQQGGGGGRGGKKSQHQPSQQQPAAKQKGSRGTKQPQKGGGAQEGATVPSMEDFMEFVVQSAGQDPAILSGLGTIDGGGLQPAKSVRFETPAWGALSHDGQGGEDETVRSGAQWGSYNA